MMHYTNPHLLYLLLIKQELSYRRQIARQLRSAHTIRWGHL